MITAARGRAATSKSERIRLAAELDRARSEIALLEEELRLEDARMAKLPARRRPHYAPADRLAILELQAARALSTTQTADRFLIRPGTAAGWRKRVDESGEGALVQLADPVNKFPDFVEQVVKRLKRLCPALGKKRIAQILARAGLHLGVNTVKRMLARKPPAANDDGTSNAPPEEETAEPGEPRAKGSAPVRATAVHHVWQMDLTIVSTASGFWSPWFPFALPPCWPFCWWVALVIDQYSRRVLSFAVFMRQPSGTEIRRHLQRTAKEVEARPRYLITDHGGSFDNAQVDTWCKGDVTRRYASVGSLNATAVVERFILSLKREMLDHVAIPFRRDDVREQVTTYLAWYHAHRPHQGLGGRTPNEVFHAQHPKNAAPRFEPRPGWNGGCARPPAPKKRHRPDASLDLIVAYTGEPGMLPQVELRRVR